jgi:hypothetical protein
MINSEICMNRTQRLVYFTINPAIIAVILNGVKDLATA